MSKIWCLASHVFGKS